ncbi:hypothetical protein FRC06_001105 [Ceratobasidium sp. 370]|nr:hypothetical protein FRC06_001105 [Ceratobasidium sp. 370]
MANLPSIGITALVDTFPCPACQIMQQGYSGTCTRPSHECASRHAGPKRPARQSTLEIVSSKMSVREMFDCLLQHGCTDLSPRVDLSEQPSMAIAGGGFGDVYRGQLRDGTAVAIKALRNHIIAQATTSKARKRAMRELYVWSKVKHQNVQELMGIVMFQGRLGMVSPWMENGNLAEYVQRYPGVDRYELCTQVARGVSYLHSIDFIHGDLKACNVLVSPEGIAKLSDFDHSILSNCTLGFTETTNAGGGTLRWMAPELLLRQEGDMVPLEKTKQSDVYALGMTMLVPAELTPILPFLQQAEEMKSKDSVISYWCGYYAAQKGLELKLSTHESHSFLFQLADSLVAIKEAPYSHTAISDRNLGYSYLEKHADNLQMFLLADAEDRRGMTSWSTANKFLAASYCLDVLSVFESAKQIHCPNIDEKQTYAYCRAGEIRMLFEDNHITPPPPPSTSGDVLLLSTSNMMHPNKSHMPTTSSISQLPSFETSSKPLSTSQDRNAAPSRSITFQTPATVPNAMATMAPSASEYPARLVLPPRRVRFSDSIVGGPSVTVHDSPPSYPKLVLTDPPPLPGAFVQPLSEQISCGTTPASGTCPTTNGSSFELASSRMSVQEMECFIAIAGGGFGDIYRGKLRDGTVVAIKALRHHILIQDTAPKALKVRGDLKARNVLVDKNDIARLSDFDHSILSNCTLLFTETTNVGGGTLRWMAPELLLSSGDDDTAPISRSKRTDIYALGMTMLEIISGRVPYAEYKVDRAIIRALDKKEFPTRPKEVSTDWIWSLLEACWDHDPDARPSASWVYDQVGVK